MASLKETDCPTCGKKATWPENKYRPFCSERCQLIDLGAWADETHRIPGQPPAHPSSSGDQDDD